MEDGFIAAESTVSPIHTKEDKEQENSNYKNEAISEQEKTGGGGYISNLISNFVSSGADEENKDDIEDNKGSGGIMNNLFSNIVSSSPRSVEANKRKLDDEDSEHIDREKAQKIDQGGSLFNNVISNLFHHHGGDEDVKETVEERKDVHENKDEAVPSTDEASILIAIARD